MSELQTDEYGAAPLEAAPVSRKIRPLEAIALWIFGITVVLIPFHWRLTLLRNRVPPVYADFTDYLLFAADIGLLLLLMLWAISHRIRPRPIDLGAPYIWIPLFGLTVAACISALTSEYRGVSAYYVLRMVLLFGLYAYVVNEVQSAAVVIAATSVQTLLQTAVALGQFATQRSIGLQWAGEPSLDPRVAGVSIVEAAGTRILRAYGLTGHPNILGGCLAFGLIVLLAVAMYSGKSAGMTASLIAVPATLALALSFSRSAWLAYAGAGLFLVGTAVALGRWAPTRRALRLALLSAVALAPLVWRNWEAFGTRLNANRSFEQIPSEIQALGERSLLTRSANRIFVEHPINGIGLGASPLAMRDYYPDFPVNYQPPHYALLAVAVETGILGAACYLLLLILPWLAIGINRKVYTSNPATVTCAALLLAMTIIGFLDYHTWTYNAGRDLHWLAFGVWSASVRRVK